MKTTRRIGAVFAGNVVIFKFGKTFTMTKRVVMASILSARSAIIVTGLGVHGTADIMKLRLLVKGVVAKGR